VIPPSIGALFPQRLAGVIRWPDAGQAVAAARAVAGAGLGSVEITMSDPASADAIAALRDLPCVVGAGTVTDTDRASRAVAAGARYLVTPFLIPEIVRAARDLGVPCILGAQTPTEIQRALELGADVVKLFPAGPIGGPEYVRALRGPMPDVPLWVSGGIRAADTAAFLEAGADIVGLTSLFPPAALRSGDLSTVAALAAQAVRAAMAVMASAA